MCFNDSVHFYYERITLKTRDEINITFKYSILTPYKPMATHTKKNEKFHQKMQNEFKQAKSDEKICIMGDLSPLMGSEEYKAIVGRHGLGQVDLIL